MKPESRIDALRREIAEHNHRYFVLDDPSVPDVEYDRLMRELQALEEAHPEFDSADSPTRRVGAAPVGEFAQVVHRVPMLSLGNAFAEDEVRAFVQRIAERVGTEAVEFSVEPKLDGLAISLWYEHGHVPARRHARRRQHRRGRDPHAAHGAQHSAGTARQATAGGARSARRGLHAARRLRGLERGAARARRTHLRQSAQRRRRQPAPARPARWRRSGRWRSMPTRSAWSRAGPCRRATRRRSGGCASAACRCARRPRWRSGPKVACATSARSARAATSCAYEIDGVVYKVDRYDWQAQLRLRVARAALGDRAQVSGPRGADHGRGDRRAGRAHRRRSRRSRGWRRSRSPA